MPPNHELFTVQTLTALNLEMTEDLWMREQELSERAKEEEGSALNDVVHQLQDVRKALGVMLDFASPRISGTDSLVDKWEAEIAAGRDPDLDEV